jgi:carboxymethylenebutenolidase
MAQTAVRSEDIICPGGMPAFLARPDRPGTFPVLVLMHERYGLVKHSRDLALRAAGDGVLAVAPNFFFKHPDQRTLNAGNSRYDLSDPESVQLIKAALTAVEGHPSADLSKVAVAGYCQTGRHPLVFAAQQTITAAVVWYGGAAPREWEVTALQPKAYDGVIAALPCPVFAAFGSDDHLIAIDDVRRLRNALEQHKKSYEMHLYAGAPHGWLNDTMPGRYRKPQADAGWNAQTRFLREAFAGEWKADQVRWRFESESSINYDFSKNVRQE